MEFSGAEILIESLLRQGIETVTGIPGGAILPVYDALARSPLRHVLGRSEQGAAFIAQGMARVTRRPAVTLATSGPGASNLLTAVADAKLDSVPLVAITGQVPTALIGTDAFQELDTMSLMRPITKACYFASSPAELLELVPLALRTATTGRPGPVAIDVPKDVQKARTSVDAWPARNESWDRGSVDRLAIQRLARLIDEAERPMLYVGGGVLASGASAALREVVQRFQLPAISSLCGLGALNADSPLNLGMLGMHGARASNALLERADVVVAIGARFDDRATGDPEKFCARATIAHIDIDPREIGKLKPVHLGIVGDARTALEGLAPLLTARKRDAWLGEVHAAHRRRGAAVPTAASRFMAELAGVLEATAIVTTDVGQHQMWAAQSLPVREPGTFLTSAGLGTMGFGLPAAIGAALAAPERRVVCLTGDGSILMNLQELAPLRELDLDVTVVVFDNGHLGLVRQQQELFFESRFSGCRFDARPDLAAVARAFGLSGVSVARSADPVGAAIEALAAGPRGPRLVHLPIDERELVLPMVPPGTGNTDAIVDRGGHPAPPRRTNPARRAVL